MSRKTAGTRGITLGGLGLLVLAAAAVVSIETGALLWRTRCWGLHIAVSTSMSLQSARQLPVPAGLLKVPLPHPAQHEHLRQWPAEAPFIKQPPSVSGAEQLQPQQYRQTRHA